jgi:hypothetical protein
VTKEQEAGSTILPSKIEQEAESRRFLPTADRPALSSGVPTGAQRLRATLHKLGQVLAIVHRDPDPGDPAAIGQWQSRIEARVVRVERLLVQQNRLLLLTLVAALGDLLKLLWLK